MDIRSKYDFKKKELQLALDRQTAAVANVIRWQSIVIKYSLQEFGVEPGDVDCDDYLDAVTGSDGNPIGMTADEFIKAMKDCIT